MLQVVEEDIVSATPLRIPRLQSLTAPNLFYPSFSYALHVGYLGFAITPFKVLIFFKKKTSNLIANAI